MKTTVKKFKVLNNVIKEQELHIKNYEKQQYGLFIKALPEIIELIKDITESGVDISLDYTSWNDSEDFGNLTFRKNFDSKNKFLLTQFEEFHQNFQKPFKEFIKPIFKIPSDQFNDIHCYLGKKFYENENIEKLIAEFSNKYLKKITINEKMKKNLIL